MKVKCISKNELCLDYDKIYDVDHIEDGLYAIFDESGDCYLYDPDLLEIISE